MSILIDKVLQQWKALISLRNTGGAPILSVSGPSGAGKTTVIKTLLTEYPSFVETTAGNPHLAELLEGSHRFNATANQQWFLDRISNHLNGASRNMPLILDQDPAAIVVAYAQMFFEDCKINEVQYASLLKRLLRIEEALQAWRSPRTVLFLDAPAEVLYQRVLRRSRNSPTPPIEWFERVRSHFLELFQHFPNATKISTEIVPPEQVAAQARALIEGQVRQL